jgi:hypothetical protein
MVVPFPAVGTRRRLGETDTTTVAQSTATKETA